MTQTALSSGNLRHRTRDLFALLDAEADSIQRDRLREEIIRINMPLARDCARRFRGRGIAEDDLEQVSYLGLLKAVQSFDPGRGVEFIGYAVPTIRGEVQRHFRDCGWSVRPPRSIQETQSKINRCESDLMQQLGRAPRPSEIAAHLDLDLEQVLDALGARGCFSPTSLDAYDVSGRSTGGETLGQRIPDLEDGFDVAEARAVLAPLLAKLSRREQLMVEMRFSRGCTQAEIGAEIGVSQMQVSRLLNRLLNKMRNQLAEAA